MKWLVDVGKWLIKARSASDIKLIQDIYRASIDDLIKERDRYKLIIEGYKKHHPENGKELDEWAKREEELHKIIIKLMQENRDLKEELIFTKKFKK